MPSCSWTLLVQNYVYRKIETTKDKKEKNEKLKNTLILSKTKCQ